MQSLWTFLKSDGGRTTLAIAAILASATVAFTIYRLNRKRKALTYEYLSMTRLLSVIDEIKNRVKVTVDDRQVKNVGIVRVKVTNTGTEPIKASDFERPINFFVAGDAHVINAYIAETKADSFMPDILFQEKEVVLRNTLFNAKDSVTFNILVSDFNGKIYADARIEGVELKQPPFVKKGSLPQIMAANVSVIAAIVGAIALLIVILQLAHAIWLSLFGLLGTTGALTLFTILVLIATRFIRQEDSYPNDYAKQVR